MTPKGKAKELVEEFMEHTVEWDNVKEVAFDSLYHAKKCSIIAVDLILTEFYVDDFYLEVKKEIEKL